MNEVIIEGFKCVECGDTFYNTPTFGYCDNTLDCAISYRDGIVSHSWVATDFDLAYLAK